MADYTLDDIIESRQLPLARDSIAFQDRTGRVRLGTVRIRPVRCGKKGCTKCPHHIYAYAQYRVGKKVLDKYLGYIHGNYFRPSKKLREAQVI